MQETFISPVDLKKIVLESVIDALNIYSKANDFKDQKRLMREPISIDEVSEMAMLSKSAIYGRVKNKTIPFEKNGGRLCFFKEDILKWNEKHLKNKEVLHG